MFVETLVLLILVVGAGLWLDTMRQHDHALQTAQRICTAHGVQLLDHTVGLNSLKLRRHDGHLALERHYSFEVSIDGSDRHRGTLCLVRGQLAGVNAPWLQQRDASTLDARAAVAELLERISHDHTT